MNQEVTDLSTQAEIDRLKAGYSRGQRLLEIAGIAAFFGFTAVYVMDIVTHILTYDVARVGLILGGALLAGLLFADFVSGLVHWAADNWGSPDWPILGTGFVRPFRHHHLDPKEMTTHDFVELNGNNCLISLPAMWWGHHCLVHFEAPGLALFWAAFWLSLSYWVLGTNQFHAWSHTDKPPRLVALLQRLHLILPVDHHHVHHVPPHAGNYCITNGWLNAPLRWIRFFEGLEWTMTALTGIRPEHDNVAREMVARSAEADVKA
jgi:plasmanylethanolamine desaturase